MNDNLVNLNIERDKRKGIILKDCPKCKEDQQVSFLTCDMCNGNKVIELVCIN